MAEFKPSEVNLGTIIAFIAPGFIAYKAICYHVAFTDRWLIAAQDKEQSVGVFLFVLLGSLVFGIVVSGIRALIVDNLLCWKRLGKLAVQRPAINWSGVDEKRLIVINDAVESFYRYYQFYSNCLVAVLLLLLAYKLSSQSQPWPFGYWIALLVIESILIWSARDSFRKYSDSLSQIAGTTGKAKEDK
jgi:uncharacterized membrane protein (DUF485 family)